MVMMMGSSRAFTSPSLQRLTAQEEMAVSHPRARLAAFRLLPFSTAGNSQSVARDPVRALDSAGRDVLDLKTPPPLWDLLDALEGEINS